MQGRIDEGEHCNIASKSEFLKRKVINIAAALRIEASPNP
jgi:hypothetical protein